MLQLPNPRLQFFAILLLAIVLRGVALTWGLPDLHRPASLHPDEWSGIVTAQSVARAPLDPTDFAFTKGTGYFYTVAAACGLAHALGLIDAGPAAESPDLVSFRRMFVAGRIVSALFSLGAVALTFWAGRRLFGAAGGLAAVLVAVSPLSVLNAHYVKTDAAMEFWVLVTLCLALKSADDFRWLLGGMFAAGVAGAFKFPGLSSALFVVAAAWALDPADRKRRLLAVAGGVALVAVGSLLVFPAAVASPDRLWSGLNSEFGKKVAGSAAGPLVRLVEYPWFVAKATGAVLPLWAIAATVFALFHRRKETLVLLAWLLPYAAIMFSSSMIVIRYAGPAMPIMALLMAGMVVDLQGTSLKEVGQTFLSVLHRTTVGQTFLSVLRKKRQARMPVLLKDDKKGQARKTATKEKRQARMPVPQKKMHPNRGWIFPAVAIATILVLAPTCVHLYTMLSPDPRDLAGAWLRDHAPQDAIIGVTPSHLGDVYNTVPIDSTRHRAAALLMRADADPSAYLDLPLDFIASNEFAWLPALRPLHPGHQHFWSTVMDPGQWRLEARFSNRPPWPGLLLHGLLPEDLYYIYQETRIYSRASPLQSDLQ